MFKIWAYTICMKYHFIGKLFAQHILTNEPLNYFHQSNIPLVRKSLCRNTLFFYLSVLYCRVVWMLSTSILVLFLIAQKKLKFLLENEREYSLSSSFNWSLKKRGKQSTSLSSFVINFKNFLIQIIIRIPHNLLL